MALTDEQRNTIIDNMLESLIARSSAIIPASSEYKDWADLPNIIPNIEKIIDAYNVLGSFVTPILTQLNALIIADDAEAIIATEAFVLAEMLVYLAAHPVVPSPASYYMGIFNSSLLSKGQAKSVADAADIFNPDAVNRTGINASPVSGYLADLEIPS